MRDLSVAVIGCGRMGFATPPHVRADLPPGWWPLNHADAVRAVPGLKLVAFCDINLEAAKTAAAKHGAAAYTDYRVLLSDHGPDIVTIATRAEGRAALIAELCESGVRGIHAEKPLCRNLREGELAAAAVTRHGVAFSYGATRRYMQAYRVARDLVTSGEFGAARQIHVHLGAGTLQWSHPHSVDIGMFFLGDDPPESGSALFTEPVNAAGDVLDADPRLAAGFLRFSNGASVVISAAAGCDVMIVCEVGNISVMADGTSIDARRPQPGSKSSYFRAVDQKTMTPQMSGLEVALTELRDAVNGGPPPSSGILQALTGQRALFALALSGLRNGQETRLDEVPLGFTVTGRQCQLFA